MKPITPMPGFNISTPPCGTCARRTKPATEQCESCAAREVADDLLRRVRAAFEVRT